MLFGPNVDSFGNTTSSPVVASNEAVQTVASMYDVASDTLKLSNLEVTGNIKTKTLETTEQIQAGSLEASGPVKGSELTTGGNLILSGETRNWILHNNGTNFYVAPSNADKSHWDWGKQTIYYPYGKIFAKELDTSSYLRYKGRNAITNGDLLNIINAKKNHGLHAGSNGDGVTSNTNCSAHHATDHGPTTKSYCQWEIRKVGERPNANPGHIGR